MKCFECNGQYRKKKIDYVLHGVNLGRFEAIVCNKCGDSMFNEDTSEDIEKAAKKKGILGLKSRTKIGRVGNSLDVKINKKIAEFLQIKKGDEVSVYPDSKNKLIVEIG